MRELPRKLTVDQLAELFEGQTRFVERLSELEDPLGAAPDLVRELPEDEVLEALSAHPAIGAKGCPRGRRASRAPTTMRRRWPSSRS